MRFKESFRPKDLSENHTDTVRVLGYGLICTTHSGSLLQCPCHIRHIALQQPIDKAAYFNVKYKFLNYKKLTILYIIHRFGVTSANKVKNFWLTGRTWLGGQTYLWQNVIGWLFILNKKDTHTHTHTSTCTQKHIHKRIHANDCQFIYF